VKPVAKPRRSDSIKPGSAKAKAATSLPRRSIDLLSDPPVGCILNCGTYGDDGPNDEGGLFLVTASGEEVLLLDVLIEQEKRIRTRRPRESRIPWDEVNALLVGRVGIHGIPETAQCISAHARLVQMIGDALQAIGASASESMIHAHAAKLLDSFARAESLWPRR
jgi:hypothetical protein